jgi:hypothetical protein
MSIYGLMMATPTLMAGDDDNALVVQRLAKLKEGKCN